MANVWQTRVDHADWSKVSAELDDFGGALLPQLLTPDETVAIRELYDEERLFRSIIDMARHRFGSGEYRYFATPYPEPIEALKRAPYPRLLPIARDWWTRLGRPAPGTDTAADLYGRLDCPSALISRRARSPRRGRRCVALRTLSDPAAW